MSTSARKSHTRIPSVNSSSANNNSSAPTTIKPPSSGLYTPATSPDSATPAGKPAFPLHFGVSNMGLANGGVGASPSASLSSNRSNGAPPTPVSARFPGPSSIAGKSQGSSSAGSGFRLRSLLPFGPNKNPTPISPNVSPSGSSNGSFGGFGSAKRSMSISGERKQSFSGSASGGSPTGPNFTANSGAADRKGNLLAKNSDIAKPTSHFGFKGSVGKGKGKAKEGTVQDDRTPVISISKQTSSDGKDESSEFGIYSGSRSMDVRRSSSDTIVSSAGRQYSSLNSRRSVDWVPGSKALSTTSIPDTMSASRLPKLSGEMESDRSSNRGPYSNAPYSYSSSSASTIPTHLPTSNEISSDSPDPLLLHQDPGYLPDTFLTGSSHDHPIDLSTIIEADSSGISKHLPSATSSEASVSPAHSRAQSEEPQRLPASEHDPKSILDGLDDLLQPPTHSSTRTVSPSASTASLTPSSQGMEADESRSPSQSPLPQPFPRTPSPTLHAPHSPFAPPENSSSTPAASSHADSYTSVLRSPFHPSLRSSFRTRLDSDSPDESGLELSMSEVEQQVRDAIRNSIGSAGGSRKSGGSAGGLTGPRGWVEDAEVRVVDGDEDEFDDSFLDGQGEERVEEAEVLKMLDASHNSFVGGDQSEGEDNVAGTEFTQADRGVSMSLNLDALDPDLRMLLSPNRLTPSPKKSQPITSTATPIVDSGTPNTTSVPTSGLTLPSTSDSAAAIASSSVLSSPWNSGNGSATIIAPTPTIPRTTGIASIRSRKEALGVDLNGPGPSKLASKTSSPILSGSTSEVGKFLITSPTSPSNSVLAKPPPLPLPSLEPSEQGGTGTVALAKNALFGRRQAGQSSSLPRLRSVTKEAAQGSARSSASSSSTINTNSGNNRDTAIPSETPLTGETGFECGAATSTITSTSTSSIPSTTISSISASTAPFPLSSNSSLHRQSHQQSQTHPSQSPVSLEVTRTSAPDDSGSPLGAFSNNPSSVRDTVATAPSPLGSVFAIATSTPVIDRMDRRPAFEFDQRHGAGTGSEFGRASGRAATVGRMGGSGAAVRNRVTLNSRPTTPSSPHKTSPTVPTYHTRNPSASQLHPQERRQPSSFTTTFPRRVASGDYPRSIDRLGSSRLSPGRSQFSTRQQQPGPDSPEIPDVTLARSTARPAPYAYATVRNRRRSLSVGGDPQDVYSASANATRGFLAATQRARESGSVVSSYSDIGRPGTSMSGFGASSAYRRERSSDEPPRDRKAPMMEWLGPRTAKAFRAAGLLDFEAPLGSSSATPSEFEGSTAGLSKHNRFSSLRTPSRMSAHSDFGTFASGRNSNRRASSGYFGLVPTNVTIPSPTSVLGSPTSAAFRERDRETPTRSASTAPTSVSGASWVRERDSERAEREKDREREREYDEMTVLKDRHAVEMSALLGALSDSQRSAKVMRDENTELRERVVEFEGDIEKLLGDVERLTMQNDELKEDLLKMKEEYDEKLEGEMDRAAGVEEENVRLREECARLAEVDAELERLKKAIAANRSRFGTLPHTGSPLRQDIRPSSPSFDFDSGEIEGFGAHEVEMSAGSDAAPISTSSRSSESKPEPKPFSTHTKSIHSPFLPSSTSSLSSAVPLSTVHTSRGHSEDSSSFSLSRRISTSSIFPDPPANMSMLMHEDSVHEADDGHHPLHHSASFQYSESDYSGFSEKVSPPSSPTIAIPIRQPEASSSQGRPYQRHRTNMSIASSQSPTTPNFSLRSSSPEILFLKPEHEMHLGDMDTESLDFQLDDEEDPDDGEIQEVPR